MQAELPINLLNFKKRRQILRRNAPEPEIILCKFLRKSQLMGFIFRRQAGLGPYIVDFYCPKCKIVIEIDGSSHLNRKAKLKDTKRDKYLQSNGIKVLRFTNYDVIHKVEMVIEKIICILSLNHP